MCYMETAGVRELRQNASALLARVEAGAEIEVTNHGRPVARLVPLDRARPSRAELIATGQLRPGSGDMLDVQPIEAPAGTPDTARLLDELREER